MSIEFAQLKDEPNHLELCPICGAKFEPFMRGMVQRKRKSFWGLFTREIRPYCALICGECKVIVGYEDPINKIWEEFYEC